MVIIVPEKTQMTRKSATRPPATLTPSLTSRFESSLAMWFPFFRLVDGPGGLFVCDHPCAPAAAAIRQRFLVQAFVDSLRLAVHPRSLGLQLRAPQPLLGLGERVPSAPRCDLQKPIDRQAGH